MSKKTSIPSAREFVPGVLANKRKPVTPSNPDLTKKKPTTAPVGDISTSVLPSSK